MDLKHGKIIGIIGVFLLCFGCHFVYDWFPNALTVIFFPVNESIWEHMKLLITPYLLFGIIEYLIFKKKNISSRNFLFQLWIVPILGVIVYLGIYIPLYLWIGENMIVSITLLFLVIIFMEMSSYYLLTRKDIKYGSIIGVLGILIIYIIFGYLAYKPCQNFIFFDSEQGKYGIHIYQR